LTLYVRFGERSGKDGEKDSANVLYILALFEQKANRMSLGNQIGKLAISGWRNWKLDMKHELQARLVLVGHIATSPPRRLQDPSTPLLSGGTEQLQVLSIPCMA
jgi:hypothetical protein